MNELEMMEIMASCITEKYNQIGSYCYFSLHNIAEVYCRNYASDNSTLIEIHPRPN